MNINLSHIAREPTLLTPEFRANRHRILCKTQEFCTPEVGPPPPVQSFWRPKRLTPKELATTRGQRTPKHVVQKPKIHERYALSLQRTQTKRAKVPTRISRQ